MIRLFHGLAAAFVLLPLLAAPGRAGEADEVLPDLREALTRLAETIGKHLDSRKEDRVVIGEFAGPGRAGPGIQEALIRALAALEPKKTAVTSAPLEVRGSYSLDEDTAGKGDPDRGVLKVEAVFYDSRTGKPLTQLLMAPVRVRNSLDLAKLFAVTTFFPAGTKERQRLQTVADGITKPTVHIDGTRISSRPDSPYAVEILARPLAQKDAQGEPRPPNPELSRDGQAFVDLKEGELYAVRIINRAAHEVAVTLTIDGLDLFTFSEVRDKDGRPRYRHMVFSKPAPGREEAAGVIRGWHHRNTGADASFAFLVTELGKGEASKLLKTAARAGTLVLTFAAAWEKDADRPKDEPPGLTVRGGSETGKGPPLAGEIEEVKRTVGAVREIVSIRYSKLP
jgi:hypothetical protein